MEETERLIERVVIAQKKHKEEEEKKEKLREIDREGYDIMPPGYESYLSDFGVVLKDQLCSEPVKWGFKIIRRMNTEKFNHLEKFGTLKCNHGYPVAGWYLVTKFLTIKKAIAKYGEVTFEDKKYIQFGDKKFFKSNFK